MLHANQNKTTSIKGSKTYTFRTEPRTSPYIGVKEGIDTQTHQNTDLDCVFAGAMFEEQKCIPCLSNPD